LQKSCQSTTFPDGEQNVVIFLLRDKNIVLCRGSGGFVVMVVHNARFARSARSILQTRLW